jgi:hypothetical protein
MTEKPVEHTEIESLKSLVDSLVKTQSLHNDRMEQLFARLGFESQSPGKSRSHDDERGSSYSERGVQLAGTLPGWAGIGECLDESHSLLAGNHHRLAPNYPMLSDNEEGLAGTNPVLSIEGAAIPTEGANIWYRSLNPEDFVNEYDTNKEKVTSMALPRRSSRLAEKPRINYASDYPPVSYRQVTSQCRPSLTNPSMVAYQEQLPTKPASPLPPTSQSVTSSTGWGTGAILCLLPPIIQTGYHCSIREEYRTRQLVRLALEFCLVITPTSSGSDAIDYIL